MYEYKGNLDRVVDGDTVDIIIDLGFKMTTNQRIRLYGIDTPEIFSAKKGSDEYNKGMAAKQVVEDRLAANDGEFTIRTHKYTGKYGRYLGEIYLKDSQISLNDELVQNGHAEVNYY